MNDTYVNISEWYIVLSFPFYRLHFNNYLIFRSPLFKLHKFDPD